MRERGDQENPKCNPKKEFRIREFAVPQLQFQRQMSPTLILLMLVLGVICARAGAAPPPAKMKEALTTTTIETALEPEQRIDCKLTFDATMDSLEQEQQQMRQLQQKGCLPSTNKPAEGEEPALPSVARHGLSGGSSQPVYELQLVVWPLDVPENDDDEFSATTTTTRAPATTTTTTRRPTTTRRTTTTTTTVAPTLQPLYEDQLVVFPQMDFQEENFDYFFDELEAAGNPSTTTRRPQRPSAAPGASADPVRVLENYHVRHPNGTEEHK